MGHEVSERKELQLNEAGTSALVTTARQVDLSIVMPAYNEAEALTVNLPAILAFCQKHGMQLIVVNDGSRDNTAQVLEQHRAHPNLTLARHKLNRGYGGAIKSGMLAATTAYVITMDADGQHSMEDVLKLYDSARETDADMVVGRRTGSSHWYRGLGKAIIRMIAKLMMDIGVHDINSGMKLYETKLAQTYLRLCPDSMAFSDVITLIFINQRHRVIETPISVHPRHSGVSTINSMTAFETVLEIFNVVLLFNPMRIFLPVSLLLMVSGVAWGLPLVIRGNGVSVGAMLAVVSGMLFFLLGLIASQLALIRNNLR
jgi:glycosyltransferase involved in cell wall biosynthesis